MTPTPTKQPNPALEWRLAAIDRMQPLQLVQLLTHLEANGIGIGPRVTPGFNVTQLKALTCTIAAYLHVLDELGDTP